MPTQQVGTRLYRLNPAGETSLARDPRTPTAIRLCVRLHRLEATCPRAPPAHNLHRAPALLRTNTNPEEENRLDPRGPGRWTHRLASGHPHPHPRLIGWLRHPHLAVDSHPNPTSNLCCLKTTCRPRGQTKDYLPTAAITDHAWNPLYRAYLVMTPGNRSDVVPL